MKSLLTILFSILALSFQTDKGCPVNGDSKNKDHQQMDLLKNRTTKSTTVTPIKITKFLAPGNDRTRFASSTYASVVGYIYDVKYGGAETCNCHAKDKSQLDIHIELTENLTKSPEPAFIIAEVTRLSRDTMTYEWIRSLRGKKVELQGWLFFDEEHDQNAVNTNPNGTNLWRTTCWEIHPCQSIRVIK